MAPSDRVDWAKFRTLFITNWNNMVIFKTLKYYRIPPKQAFIAMCVVGLVVVYVMYNAFYSAGDVNTISLPENNINTNTGIKDLANAQVPLNKGNLLKRPHNLINKVDAIQKRTYKKLGSVEK